LNYQLIQNSLEFEILFFLFKNIKSANSKNNIKNSHWRTRPIENSPTTRFLHLGLVRQINSYKTCSLICTRGIFIFGGGNKRLRNVTKMYCRRKKECLGKFKFSLNRLKKQILRKPIFVSASKGKVILICIIKRITNYFSSSTMNNFLIANLLHFC
jgi:hypothetical protein